MSSHSLGEGEGTGCLNNVRILLTRNKRKMAISHTKKYINQKVDHYFLKYNF